jgi:hypothetical protein
MARRRNNDDEEPPGLTRGLSFDEGDEPTNTTFNIEPLLAARYGLAVNEQGRIYERGKFYSAEIKLLVSTRIARLCGNSPAAIISVNVSRVSRETNTSRRFVRKVRDEMIENDGNIIHPKRIKQKRKIGPGVNTFDDMDMFVLLFLYLDEPSRSNFSYVERLYCITGTLTSTATVSRWFNKAFPISGGFRKPNLAPLDKFKQSNFWKAEDYLEAIATIAPRKLRFGDEKLIKGAEVYCRRSRRNVLTGEW